MQLTLHNDDGRHLTVSNVTVNDITAIDGGCMVTIVEHDPNDTPNPFSYYTNPSVIMHATPTRLRMLADALTLAADQAERKLTDLDAKQVPEGADGLSFGDALERWAAGGAQ